MDRPPVLHKVELTGSTRPSWAASGFSGVQPASHLHMAGADSSNIRGLSPALLGIASHAEYESCVSRCGSKEYLEPSGYEITEVLDQTLRVGGREHPAAVVEPSQVSGSESLPRAPLPQSTCHGALYRSEASAGFQVPILVTVAEASDMAAFGALAPLSNILGQSLTAAHRSIASEYVRLHTILRTTEDELRAASARYTSLEQDCARLTAARDAAVTLGEQHRKDADKAIEEMWRFRNAVSQLGVERHRLISEHALHTQEMTMLKDENTQLRNGTQVKPTQGCKIFDCPCAVEQTVQRKDSSAMGPEELPSVPDSPSYDPDIVCAAELAEEYAQRRRNGHNLHLQVSLTEDAQRTQMITSYYQTRTHSMDSPRVSYTAPTPWALPAPSGAASLACSSVAFIKSDSAISLSQPVHNEATDIAALDGVAISRKLEVVSTPTRACQKQLTSESAMENDDRHDKHAPTAEREGQPRKTQRTDHGLEDAQTEPITTDTVADDVQAASSRVTTPLALSSMAVVMPPGGRPGVPLPISSSSMPLTDLEAIRLCTPAGGTPVGPQPLLDAAQLPDTIMGLHAEPHAREVHSLPGPSIATARIKPSSSLHAPARPALPRRFLTSDRRSVTSPSTYRPSSTPPSAVQLLPSFTPSDKPLPSVIVKSRHFKSLSLAHMPLMYETRDDKLSCKLCAERSEKFDTTPTVLPENASWADLIRHYQEGHPAACEKLLAMSVEKIRIKKIENDAKVPFLFGSKKRKFAPPSHCGPKGKRLDYRKSDDGRPIGHGPSQIAYGPEVAGGRDFKLKVGNVLNGHGALHFPALTFKRSRYGTQ
ncbi:hypothetical protein K466DRAFT_631949 [Polyporus arcularius HHB13444]|uniref:Uncharacterized protein n=1 Tax=Polyporus arcularius HHB13444 TaxID=1314778 RepID=A0A5C3NX52_9APHY|nr:hypothetical protein K466DRAFT_631949 [Polyporus arcularius HHB13444]